MKAKTVSTVFMLAALLAGVVVTMQRTDALTIQNLFASLGIESSTGGGLQAGSSRDMRPDETKLSICPTRVRAIHFSDGARVEEFVSGLSSKWLAHRLDERARKEKANEERELSYLEIEKWLSQHCQVIVLVKAPVAGEGQPPPASPLAEIEYIDSSRLRIERVSEHEVAIDGVVYRSDDLLSALQELREIAQFASSSSAAESVEVKAAGPEAAGQKPVTNRDSH